MTATKVLCALLIGASLGAASTGCGAGPDGATINISNSQNQTNEQTQVQNESELDCTRDCKIDPTTGIITAPEDCKGGASSVIVVLTDDSKCDSVTELITAQSQSTAEVEG